MPAPPGTWRLVPRLDRAKLLRSTWKLCRASVLSALVLVVLFVGWALSLPFPSELVHDTLEPHVELLDRGGARLARVRSSDGVLLHEPFTLEQAGPYLVPALLAAEDARFYRHPGVDPLAVTRAFAQLIRNRRVVSGASTLTQQLARTTFERPRTLWGKLQEMARALRIEHEWTKQQILEAYLNRVGFGPNIQGVSAASWYYFDKPPAELSLAEAATLVGIPRGPSLYDPDRGVDKVERRRNRILARMQEHGLASTAQVTLAQHMPVQLHRGSTVHGAHHWVRKLAQQRTPESAPTSSAQAVRVRTTLDASLQSTVEAYVREHTDRLARVHARHAAVLVVDNRSREVLAYVGSPDYSEPREGQNDGAHALRQPGSTLKPFVYATALSQLHWTAATLLPDIEQTFQTRNGLYTPRNYDLRFHGPVRLREALGNSLNIPAVYATEQLGPARVLETLHRLGFASLTEGPEHYGVALALGDGEVRLNELAAAYASLANLGAYGPLRTTFDAPDRVTQVMEADVAALITDILSDPHARSAAFGRGNPLEFEFDVAAKTGTSKGHRDNWTIGFSSEVTVAVWVGNFDGSPMQGASGITGAGPLFHDVMLAAMARLEPAKRFPKPLRLTARNEWNLVQQEICAASGKLPTDACTVRVTEWFRPARVPQLTDDRFVAAWIDRVNGLSSAPGCPDASHEIREFYPPRFVSWALHAKRPLAPTQLSPRCPSAELPRVPTSESTEAMSNGRVTITSPPDGSRFRFDPELPASRQQLVFSAEAQRGATVQFELDGVVLSANTHHEVLWPLVPGMHRLSVRDEQGQEDVVHFRVR